MSERRWAIVIGAGLIGFCFSLVADGWEWLAFAPVALAALLLSTDFDDSREDDR